MHDVMFEEMTTFASEFGNQTLVTDLVNELSSGLEIPFLLSGSPCSDFEKKGKCNELLFDREKCDFQCDDLIYDKDENNLWMNQDPVYNCNTVKREVELICEADDLQKYLHKSENFTTDSKTDSSGHGSGSDTSSTELWTVKRERNASPVTPPEERISPENVIFFPSNELQFIPISQEGFRKTKQAFNGGYGRAIRIQPKPNASSLKSANGQLSCERAKICNVIKDGKPLLFGVKKGLNGMAKDEKNVMICRKDSEILQAKRKQERMIRNRESAYLSRKRKKEYVAGLEKQVQELVNENSQLREENHSLKQRLMKYEQVESLDTAKKCRNVFTDSPKRTTTLFALVLTICFNIGSFSNYLNHGTEGGNSENSLQNDEVPFHVQNARHTRSLLWTDPELEDLKSFANFSKTSCPVNQTESIRLESELRRWIRGDDGFSRPTKRNVSSHIDEYFFSSERSHKSQSKSKRKNRVRKMHSSSNIEVDVFRMKPHFFNFDTFFEAINRRDDTFYLVSFSADHLLLPALAHNKTSRPKMSLMLPAFLSNATMSVSSDQVEMMQIDCEVTNTQLLSVNENDIPSHMRPYLNSTAKQKSSSAEEAEFPEFLYDSMNEKKESNENFTNSMKRNFSLSRINNLVNGRIMQHIGKNRRERTIIPVGDHLHQVVKGKDTKLKSNNSDKGYLGNTKRGRGSTNNDGEDGIHFIDNSAKGFLQTLMEPPVLSETKHFHFNKKTYVKNYKTALKFLFP